MFFFFQGYGDHRVLHRVDRRQRQMCIRDRGCAVARMLEDRHELEHGVFAGDGLFGAFERGRIDSVCPGNERCQFR